MKKDPRIFLKHIIISIEKIEEYCYCFDYEKFLGDSKLQDAVVRQIEVISEAAKHIPDGLRNHYPQISWYEIIKMRELLINDYLGVDLDLVWQSVKKDLPKLKKEVEKILENRSK